MADSLLAQVQEILLGQKNRLASWKADVDAAVAHLNTSAGTGVGNYYVDQQNPDASDANSGVSGKPLKSIKKAVEIGFRYGVINIYLKSGYLVSSVEDLKNHPNVRLHLQGNTLKHKRALVDEPGRSADFSFPAPSSRVSHVPGFGMFYFLNTVGLEIIMGLGNIVYPPCYISEDAAGRSDFYVKHNSKAIALTGGTHLPAGVKLQGKGIVSCIEPSNGTSAETGFGRLIGHANNTMLYSSVSNHFVATSQDVLFRTAAGDVGLLSDQSTVATGIALGGHNGGLAAIIADTKAIQNI